MTGGRERLRRLLADQGVLWASPAQPIRHRDGAPAPWAFYSWNVTLTPEGLRLAAACLLERLQTFQATQLATLGYTGIPLLSACVLMGGDRYTGLCIRERRKPYLSCRRVEGPLDPKAPVVVVDDSLSSGTSLEKAIRALEEEGATVEGAVALVHFPLRGGLEWANAAGYRTETVFDVWSDLGMARTMVPPVVPDRLARGPEAAPEGLHPAALARFAAAFYLRHGRAPLAPRRMDRACDGRGGVFVSFRERGSDHRLARDGFWHFAPEEADPCRDVITAAVRTVRGSAGAISLRNLAGLKIAVTFLGPLRPAPLRGLDFDRYGIVVRSRAFPHKRGGALPNTQVFISEIEQYRQARVANAGLHPAEPAELFRHELTKHVEPGEDWLPYGIPEGPGTLWWRDRALGRRLTARAREVIRSALGRREETQDRPPPAVGDGPPCTVAGVAVRLYRDGLAGYGIALGPDLEAGLVDAARQAASDPRHAARRAQGEPDGLAVVVSVLHHPERLGGATPGHVAWKIRRGLDAVGVERDGRVTVFLPSVLTYNDWSREELVSALLRAAGGGQDASCRWTTWQVAEWVESRGGEALPLRFGFPQRSGRGEPDVRALIAALGAYIERSLGPDGLPCYYRSPTRGTATRHGTAARAVHGLMALDLAGAFLDRPAWRAVARDGYADCLRHVKGGRISMAGLAGGPLADCVLLAGVALNRELASAAPAGELAARIRGLSRPDGRISDVPKRLDLPDDQDFLPGAALWALAEYDRAAGSRMLPKHLGAHAAWYGHRFRAVPSWGMAGWQPQGWHAVYAATGDPAGVGLAFDIADWAIDRQLEKSGAFLEELSPNEPSFNTGFIAEGVASAWALAVQLGEAERAGRYRRSWTEAVRFLDTLIIHPEDTFGMADGAAAIGGVRCTLSRSDVRIDQVSHTLHAIVLGAGLLGDTAGDELLGCQREG